MGDEVTNRSASPPTLAFSWEPESVFAPSLQNTCERASSTSQRRRIERPQSSRTYYVTWRAGTCKTRRERPADLPEATQLVLKHLALEGPQRVDGRVEVGRDKLEGLALLVVFVLLQGDVEGDGVHLAAKPMQVARLAYDGREGGVEVDAQAQLAEIGNFGLRKGRERERERDAQDERCRNGRQSEVSRSPSSPHPADTVLDSDSLASD